MRELLRIGQVSKLYGISLDTLRHYDKKGLLKPVVDKYNGYRYYSFDHLDILEMIIMGKSAEVPLDEIKSNIELESIDSYLAMMKKQNDYIEEKQKSLNSLKIYTDEMTSLLEKISTFKNDYDFKSIKSVEDTNIHIYSVGLDSLIEDDPMLNSIYEFESIDQWFLYQVDGYGAIVEDRNWVGLSIEDRIGEKVDLGGMEKYDLIGSYRSIEFWGRQEEVLDYLAKLSSHFNLKNMDIMVNYEFALLHKDMKHEYFVNIYFKDN